MSASQAAEPIRIDADTTGFESAMRDISVSTEQFGRIFASSLRVAALSGRDFDDTLRTIALRISTLAFNKAFQPLEDLFGALVAGAGQTLPVGIAQGPSSAPAQQRNASIVFNVQTPDAAAFRKSESQISSMLARAVARGNRGL